MTKYGATKENKGGGMHKNPFYNSNERKSSISIVIYCLLISSVLALDFYKLPASC